MILMLNHCMKRWIYRKADDTWDLFLNFQNRVDYNCSWMSWQILMLSGARNYDESKCLLDHLALVSFCVADTYSEDEVACVHCVIAQLRL